MPTKRVQKYTGSKPVGSTIKTNNRCFTVVKGKQLTKCPKSKTKAGQRQIAMQKRNNIRQIAIQKRKLSVRKKQAEIRKRKRRLNVKKRARIARKRRGSRDKVVRRLRK
jgi:hypothetical protein